MSHRMYRIGRRIRSISHFDKCESKYYMVRFGSSIIPKTVHKSFLMSWQYRTLQQFIDRGAVWIAERKEIQK